MNNYLDQGETWQQRDGTFAPIADMDDAWRLHSLRLLERRAEVLAARWTHNQFVLAMTSGGGPSGTDTASHLDVVPRGAEAALRWIRTRTLYRTLLLSLPTTVDELMALAERARHWSTCAARRSSDAPCTCRPGSSIPGAELADLARAIADARPHIPDQWVRGFLGINTEVQP